MDTTRYSKWGGSSEEVPGGHWGRRVHWSGRPLFLALAVLVVTVLWAVILSILLSKAKLMEQESALRELREVTQGLAEASRNREDVRTELFRALEAVRFSCEPCPTSWLSFEGSCYFFSVPKTTWAAAQGHCADASAHLVIVGGLEEQGFLTRNTGGRGYWLGLRAVRHLGKVQGYQWVDGVSLSFSHWNQGEPNDARGREDCVMMLRTGLWNDAPCDSEKDGWICEKRHNC
ncbi:C-type lectin domain family 4 member G [Macaca fascicularis]|uniref:C-type lectin domain family 4 member G n=1 Tax=Macaca fascicularis TaxID=9541 RepID=G7PYX0_MACFA|nr:C-type lectin domain family 4 member G [Macaca fascicularis]